MFYGVIKERKGKCEMRHFHLKHAAGMQSWFQGICLPTTSDKRQGEKEKEKSDCQWHKSGEQQGVLSGLFTEV